MDKNEILEILRMPEEEFRKSVMPKAFDAYREDGGALYAAAMLGYTNICKNSCLYCGMRAPNRIPRYRLDKEDILGTARLARDKGFTRMFLIAGEDPGFGVDKLAETVSGLKAMGFTVSLACGEYSAQQYAELRDAGASEYVMKFEMSQKEVFDRLNPSTSFEKRMAAIEAIKASGMELASGNIVAYPGQTLEMQAEDIVLMLKLGISWAPVVPYMPAANTPLAAEGGRGDRILNLKEIAILRLCDTKMRITAGQPGDDLKNGFSDVTGNLDAIRSGANLLFCDILPEAQAQSFKVVDYRELRNREHINEMAELSGLELKL